MVTEGIWVLRGSRKLHTTRGGVSEYLSGHFLTIPVNSLESKTFLYYLDNLFFCEVAMIGYPIIANPIIGSSIHL